MIVPGTGYCLSPTILEPVLFLFLNPNTQLQQRIQRDEYSPTADNCFCG